MKKYNLATRRTELRAWAYEAKIEWVENEAPRYAIIQEINDWLIDNRVKNQHYGGLTWYLKDEGDIIAFKLRWS
jgi:tRNA(Ile)-lysidine synthase TilS/MesJ